MTAAMATEREEMRVAEAAPGAVRGAPAARVVDGFALEEKLGAGAFGTVFRARRLRDGQVVALKLAENERAREALRREARARALGLAHENIVRTIEVSLESDPPFIAVELCPGGDLRALLVREGPLAPRRAQAILRDIGEALACAHDRGVLHLDVKPENILFDTDGRAKLADFGIGADLVLGGAAAANRYVAPEVIEGGKVDGRADIYALGVVLFEMLTGRPPSGAERLSDVRPGLAGCWDEIFRRCYTRVERRYDSVRTFLRDLRTVFQPRRSALEMRRDRPATPEDADLAERFAAARRTWESRLAGPRAARRLPSRAWKPSAERGAAARAALAAAAGGAAANAGARPERVEREREHGGGSPAARGIAAEEATASDIAIGVIVFLIVAGGALLAAAIAH